MISKLTSAFLRPIQLRSSGVIIDSGESVIGELPVFLPPRFRGQQDSAIHAKLLGCPRQERARCAVEAENPKQTRRANESSASPQGAAPPFWQKPSRRLPIRSHR